MIFSEEAKENDTDYVLKIIQFGFRFHLYFTEELSYVVGWGCVIEAESGYCIYLVHFVLVTWKGSPVFVVYFKPKFFTDYFS